MRWVPSFEPGIRVREIWDLGSSGVSDPSARLDQLYAWYVGHLENRARGILFLGASSVAVVIAGLFQHQHGTTWVPLIAASAASVVVLFVGLVLYIRIGQVYREYVAAQRFLAAAFPIAGLLKQSRPNA